MPAEPIQVGGVAIDFSPRVFSTATVVGSPAAATETTIASVTVGGNLSTALGVVLLGYAAYTVGASGVSVTLKLRQTDTSGSTIKTSGAVTAVAAELNDRAIIGVDVGQVAARQVYVLTMTVGSGAAASTVSAVSLVAIAV